MTDAEMTPENFRRIREKVLGLTRQEFATIFGFTYRHVHNLEEGITPINKRNAMLMQLAKKSHQHGLIKFKRST